MINEQTIKEDALKISDSQLIKFYLNKEPDNRGRMIKDILHWDDEHLESIHDYIQWLFPLQERSSFNPDAPLLNNKDIEAFNSNPELWIQLKISAETMAGFYGFKHSLNEEKSRFFKSDEFEEKSHNWISSHNHNFLRITRILKSLTMLGHAKLAIEMLKILEEVQKENPQIISRDTLDYWQRATNKEL